VKETGHQVGHRQDGYRRGKEHPEWRTGY
jgi:hypothetical protein